MTKAIFYDEENKWRGIADNGRSTRLLYDTEKEAIDAAANLGTLMLLNRMDRMEAVLRVVIDELRERIDGATETQGRDTWISSLIDICENALTNA